MMGRTLYDPDQVESTLSEIAGFGFFDFAARFKKSKKVTQVRYIPGPHHLFSNTGEIVGYEIDCGELEYGDSAVPLFTSRMEMTD